MIFLAEGEGEDEGDKPSEIEAEGEGKAEGDKSSEIKAKAEVAYLTIGCANSDVYCRSQIKIKK